MAKNVLGGELEACSTDPLTGFYRDGCCNTGADDVGVHSVCALVDDQFLEFLAGRGERPHHTPAGGRVRRVEGR